MTATTPDDRQTPMPVQHIRPERGVFLNGLRESWAYRGLLYFFVWRDVKVRYKQTILGVSWVFLQPILQVLIFTFIGSKFGIGSDGVPYPIFVLAALLPWNYFSFALTNSSLSLVKSPNLVTKVYFPRIVVPGGSVLSGLVDFSIAFALMVGLMVYYQVPLTLKMLLLPAFLAIAIATALGVGLFLAALNVRFRDVQHVIPFTVQFWFFASPIMWPSSKLEGMERILMGLNPMAGVAEGFRWALLGTDPPVQMLALSAGVAVAALTGGLLYFYRMERSFADVI